MMGDSGLRNIDTLAVDVSRRRGPVARDLVGDIIQLIEFVLVIALSVAVAFVYHTYFLLSIFDFQYYAAAGIIGATVLTALLRRDGFYEFEQLSASSRSLRAIISRWALVVLGLLAFGFALKVSEHFSRVWLFSWSLATVAAIIILRTIAAHFLRQMSRAGGAFARRVAIVGATNLAEKFAERASDPENGVSIAGIYDAGFGNADETHHVAARGDLTDLAKAARQNDIDDIIIATPEATSEEMARLIRRLSNLPVSIAICPNAHWLEHHGGEISLVAGARVLSLYRRPLEGWGSVLKNLEDFVLGAVLLVVCSPFLLMIAAAIKIQGKGPIFFAQQRHGFNNAVFKIYKFRTMTVSEDGEKIVQATPDDPRITPLGKFLRRYSLDELPQLFNVVRGEMSLVGPRPHALAHNHHYARAIENYSGRHKVKPGITGWAQVNGYRGETSENEQMEQRVRYDLEYVDNWSLWFDLKILILTVKAVVFPKNAV